MAFLDRLTGGLRGLVRRRRVEQELDEELRAYLAESMAANEAAGMSPDEARRAARAARGSPEAVKDYVRDEGSRPWAGQTTCP